MADDQIEAGTFGDFIARVQETLDGTAEGKGYNTTGVDGPNELYAFVRETVGNDGHAIGECIYKIRRYAAKGDPTDLIKLASWAYLIWRHRR